MDGKRGLMAMATLLGMLTALFILSMPTMAAPMQQPDAPSEMNSNRLVGHGAMNASMIGRGRHLGMGPIMGGGHMGHGHMHGDMPEECIEWMHDPDPMAHMHDWMGRGMMDPEECEAWMRAQEVPEEDIEECLEHMGDEHGMMVGGHHPGRP